MFLSKYIIKNINNKILFLTITASELMTLGNFFNIGINDYIVL